MMRRLAGLGLSSSGGSKTMGPATAISRHVFKLLNDQGNREWEASLSYAAASLWFAHNELPGSAGWCQTHSDEERGHAMKIFSHLAARRIEEDEKETGYGSVLAAGLSSTLGREALGKEEADAVGGGKQRARQPAEGDLEKEEPPQDARTFEWEASPNVLFDIKGPFPTTFPDPIAIWRSALEQERANSRRYFELMQAVRAESDFTTEHLLMSFYVPEQLEEEKAVEEIYNNALLVTKKGPELYFELDTIMHQKPH